MLLFLYFISLQNLFLYISYGVEGNCVKAKYKDFRHCSSICNEVGMSSLHRFGYHIRYTLECTK